MERGNVYELFARDHYSEHHAKVKECGFIVRDFSGFKIGYSPDGLIGDDGLIEIKAPARAKHVKEICENTEPSEYMMQIQAGLLVTGRKWCDYVAHYNGMHQRIVRIYPDAELHEKIIEAAKTLEDCICLNIEKYNENTSHLIKTKRIESEMV